MTYLYCKNHKVGKTCCICIEFTACKSTVAYSILLSSGAIPHSPGFLESLTTFKLAGQLVGNNICLDSNPAIYGHPSCPRSVVGISMVLTVG